MNNRISLNDIPIELFLKYFNETNTDSFIGNSLAYEDLRAESSDVSGAKALTLSGSSIYNTSTKVAKLSVDSPKVTTINGIVNSDKLIFMAVGTGTNHSVTDTVVYNLKYPKEITLTSILPSESTLQVEYDEINVAIPTGNNADIKDLFVFTFTIRENGETYTLDKTSAVAFQSIYNKTESFITSGTFGSETRKAIIESIIDKRSISENITEAGSIIATAYVSSMFSTDNVSYVVYEKRGNLHYYSLIVRIDKRRTPILTDSGKNVYIDSNGSYTLKDGYKNRFYIHQDAIRSTFRNISKEHGWQYLPGTLSDGHAVGKVALIQEGNKLRLGYAYDVKKTVTYTYVDALPTDAEVTTVDITKKLRDRIVSNGSSPLIMEPEYDRRLVLLNYLNDIPVIDHQILHTDTIESVYSKLTSANGTKLVVGESNIDLSTAKNAIVRAFTYTTNVNRAIYDITYGDNIIDIPLAIKVGSATSFSSISESSIIYGADTDTPYILVPVYCDPKNKTDTFALKVGSDVTSGTVTIRTPTNTKITFVSGKELELRKYESCGISTEALQLLFDPNDEVTDKETKFARSFVIVYPIGKLKKKTIFKFFGTLENARKQEEKLDKVVGMSIRDPIVLNDYNNSTNVRTITTGTVTPPQTNIQVTQNTAGATILARSSGGSKNFITPIDISGNSGTINKFGTSVNLIKNTKSAGSNSRMLLSQPNFDIFPSTMIGTTLVTAAKRAYNSILNTTDTPIEYYLRVTPMYRFADNISFDNTLDITFESDKTDYFRDPYIYSSNRYIKREVKYDVYGRNDSTIVSSKGAESNSDGFKKITGIKFKNDIRNTNMLLIEDAETGFSKVEATNNLYEIKEKFKELKSYYIDGTLELRGDLIDDKQFYNSRVSHLEGSLLRFIKGNDSYIDLEKESYTENINYINTYNYCKGIQQIVAAHNTTLDKIKSVTPTNKLEDINSRIILSRMNYSPEESKKTTSIGTTLFTDRTLIEKIRDSETHPTEESFIQSEVARHNMTKTRITNSSGLDKPVVNLGYHNLKKLRTHESRYTASGDVYRENIAKILTNFMYNGNEKELYSLSQLVSDGHGKEATKLEITENTSTYKKSYTSDMLSINNIDNLLRDIILVDNNSIMEVL